MIYFWPVIFKKIRNGIQYTYFLPLSSGSRPAITAAKPVAPAPSTTAFSSSMRRRMAIEIQASLTVTILSMRGPPVARALTPTVGTVKPDKFIDNG